MTAGIRLTLAATALAATVIDPGEPSQFVPQTYAALVLYLGYAALLYLAARRQHVRLSPTLTHMLPLIDVAAYGALIGLSGGSNSIYFVLFFFGILIASFRGGLEYGVAITAVSVLLFVTVGYLSRPVDSEFDLNRFLLRSGSLLVLGYLIAYRGGYEQQLRRRLELLRDLSLISNPRFGPDRMLSRSLDHLCAFYNAELCLAVVLGPGEGEPRLLTATAGTPAPAPQLVPPAFSTSLLAMSPNEIACVDATGTRRRLLATPGMPERGWQPADGGQYEQVSDLLGQPAYMSVPLRAAGRDRGRLFIGARTSRYSPADCEFLLQATDQVMPALAHVELVERMATRATDDERRRIALDLHDRIIQPHIGLQLGIQAIEESASGATEATIPMLRTRLRALGELAAQGLADLRGYVHTLRYGTRPGDGPGLVDSLRRFAGRYQEATGIQVSIETKSDVWVGERLASEVFSMVSEAVSNVRRHTSATTVSIRLERRGERLLLRIENPEDPGSPCTPFVPQSLTQRAAAVSGALEVHSGSGRTTAVLIEIPL